MKFSKCWISLAVLLAMVFAISAQAQVSSNFEGAQTQMADSVNRLRSMIQVPAAYRAEALHLTIDEANRVAQELQLPENLPITESNLVANFISSPRMAKMMSTIGNITTSNYTYYFSVGSKFSFLTKNGFDHEYKRLRDEYLWPTNRMDTNAAYQLAEQWLSEVSMDVKALNRDCIVDIDVFTPEGDKGQHFVPVYWVYWVKRGQQGRGSIASVELFEPTKTIRQLRVEEPQYILRKALEITNLDALLSPANDTRTGLGISNTFTQQKVSVKPSTLAISDMHAQTNTNVQPTRQWAARTNAPPGMSPRSSGFRAGPPRQSFNQAIVALRRARLDLQNSTNNFNGHQQSALDACDKAIQELETVVQSSGANPPLVPPAAPPPTVKPPQP